MTRTARILGLAALLVWPVIFLVGCSSTDLDPYIGGVNDRMDRFNTSNGAKPATDAPDEAWDEWARVHLAVLAELREENADAMQSLRGALIEVRGSERELAALLLVGMEADEDCYAAEARLWHHTLPETARDPTYDLDEVLYERELACIIRGDAAAEAYNAALDQLHERMADSRPY